MGSPQPQAVGPQPPVNDFDTDAAMAPYFSRTASVMSDIVNAPCICIGEYTHRHCRRLVIYLSRRIYGKTDFRDGVVVPGPGGRDPAAHPRAPPDRRGLRL